MRAVYCRLRVCCRLHGCLWRMHSRVVRHGCTLPQISSGYGSSCQGSYERLTYPQMGHVQHPPPLPAGTAVSQTQRQGSIHPRSLQIARPMHEEISSVGGPHRRAPTIEYSTEPSFNTREFQQRSINPSRAGLEIEQVIIGRAGPTRLL